MTVEISADDFDLLQELVKSGRYTSVTEALHQGVMIAATEEPVTDEYRSYLDEAIQAGLADVEAGRTIPAEEFLSELRSRRMKQAQCA